MLREARGYDHGLAESTRADFRTASSAPELLDANVHFYTYCLVCCGKQCRVVVRRFCDIEDLRRVYTYSMDEKRSVRWLKEQKGSLVFEEIAASSDDAGNGSAAGDAMET